MTHTAAALSFPTILFTPSSRLDIIFSCLNTVTGTGLSRATYTSGGEESAETEWASSLWQLRNRCIHSRHWDLPMLMLKLVPPEWGSPLDYEEENSGPIRSVLVGSSSPVGAQPLGDRPGLVTEWLASVPALPGPQLSHLQDEQIPFLSAPSESQHMHLPPPPPRILLEAPPLEQLCPQSCQAFLPIQCDRMAARRMLTSPVKPLDDGPQEW